VIAPPAQCRPYVSHHRISHRGHVPTPSNAREAPADQQLDLPPLFRAIGLREVGDAFTKAIAVAPEEGAGTLVWTRRFDLVELAVVLEPEEPLATARRAFFSGMNAAADALAAHCPPEKPIVFGWPGTITLDGGLIGGGRLYWPEGASEHEPPPFLVFGLMLRLMMHAGSRAADWSASKATTSLEAEGFEILDPRAVIASFTRHLMSDINRWQTDLARLAPEKGTRRGIDANGDLLVHRATGAASKAAERRSLIEGLTAAEWLDRETGEPLL
jgi:hypothetical protein